MVIKVEATKFRARIENGQQLHLRNLPFPAGQEVEVTLKAAEGAEDKAAIGNEPVPGSYKGWLRAFAMMPKDAGVDDAEWARVEAEMKAADLADMEKTLAEIRQLLGE